MVRDIDNAEHSQVLGQRYTRDSWNTKRLAVASAHARNLRRSLLYGAHLDDSHG
jgi:hypothetical protein